MKASSFLPLFVVFLVLPVSAQGSAVKRFPEMNGKGVNPDTHLVLTFATDVSVGKTGQVRIYDAADHHLVDMLDLSIPAGPNPRNRIRTGPPPAAATWKGPSDLHSYQLDTVGGLQGFHFYPIIVHGGVATIYPHSHTLTYGHAYEVEIDRGVLVPASGRFEGFDKNHAWIFTTKANPPAATATRLVVAADGTGDFNTIQGAVDFVPSSPVQRVTIFIKNGHYEEIVFFQNKSNITFRGEDRNKVQIGYGNNSAFNPPMPGPSRRCAFSVYDSNGIELENLTLNNYYIGQAEALLIFGQKNIVRNVTIKGSGDALNIRGSVYFTDSTIIGDGDTILGVGAAFFNHCEIESVGPFMWIRNPETNHGNVFVNSTFIAIDRPLPWTVDTPGVTPVNASKVLARLPDNHGLNYPFAEAVLINCKLKGVPPEGWGPIDGDNSHIHFWEFNSTDLEGKPIDMSHRHPTSKRLTIPRDAETIAKFSNPAYVLGWAPAPDSK